MLLLFSVTTIQFYVISYIFCVDAKWKNTCDLKQLGLKHNIDKFDADHLYEDLYCEVFKQIQNNEAINMLEIGFGCGGLSNKASNSAILWKSYLNNLNYYAINYLPKDNNKYVETTNCIRRFLESNPTAVKKVYFGYQNNITFLNDVIQNYPYSTVDVVIDDGGSSSFTNGGNEMSVYNVKSTFLHLWPLISPGGLYIMEDMRRKTKNKINSNINNGGNSSSISSSNNVKSSSSRSDAHDDNQYQLLTRKAILHWLGQMIKYTPEDRNREKNKLFFKSIMGITSVGTTTGTTNSNSDSNSNRKHVHAYDAALFAFPKDLVYIGCSNQACVFRKSYDASITPSADSTSTVTNTTTDHHHESINNNNNNNNNNRIKSQIIKRNCNLKELGKVYQVDKFDDGHKYEDLYCDAFESIKNNKEEITMLEIGFGCGHHVHGASAKLFKNYFHNLKYYSIDYVPFSDMTAWNKTIQCVHDNLKKFPNIAEKVYFGDQANLTFLQNDVYLNYPYKTFDIVIDDGGHHFHEIKTSFLFFWSKVNPGGLYIIEDLRLIEDGKEIDDNKSQLTPRKVIQHWMGQLIRFKSKDRIEHGNNNQKQQSNSNSYDPMFFPFPKDLVYIGCINQACLFRKSYNATITTAAV